MTHQPFIDVVFPDRLPRDEAHERANAERIREAEIAALLRERDDLLRQREAANSKPREKLGIVVDKDGRDTGLRVKNVTAALHREEVDAALRKIDESLDIVDRELRARGHDT
jgi:hypothetical protein